MMKTSKIQELEYRLESAKVLFSEVESDLSGENSSHIRAYKRGQLTRVRNVIRDLERQIAHTKKNG